MICAEWWAFEVIIVLAGTIGVKTLAATTILMSFSYTLFMVPLGVQEATSALIGNCIGANNVPLAKRFNSLNSKFALACVLTLAITTALCRDYIVSCFTQDAEVTEIAKFALLISCLWSVFDGMQGYYQGPIRGLGLQKVASFVAIACYWILGIPLAYLFGKTLNYGLTGLQIGIGIAVFVEFVAYFLI